MLVLIAVLYTAPLTPAQDPNQPHKRVRDQEPTQESIEEKEETEETTESAQAKKQRVETEPSSSSAQAASSLDIEQENVSMSAAAAAQPARDSTLEEKQELWNAVASGEVDKLIAHLTQFPQDIDLVYDDQLTLLMVAIDANEYNAFIEILNRTSPQKINAQDDEGYTALFHAVLNDEEEFTQLLLAPMGLMPILQMETVGLHSCRPPTLATQK